MFFANHARTVTLVVRGDSLEKSMSHYLIEQIRGKPNIQVALHGELQALHGEKATRGGRLARPPIRRRPPRRQRRRVRVHRRRRRDPLAARSHPPRRTWLRLHGRGRGALGAMAARPRPVPAGDRPSGDLRLRRRAFEPGQARRAAVGEGSMAIAFVHQYLAHAGSAPAR
jgi:thioredoxin reductase (NADPH)